MKKNLLINILYSIICGIIVGIVVFFFKLISKIITDKSHYIYQITKDNIIYIIITFIIIIGFACLMYYLHKNIPHCKGGGIPRSEGYLRGELKFNSLKALLGIVVGSFISYMVGIPVGTEGPSVLIGTSIGDLSTKPIKKHRPLRKYIATGGAASGFAVATGAPLTGILFALEEIHKKVTPLLLLTVSISVISSMVVNISLCSLFDINYRLFDISILPTISLKHLLYILLLGLLLGISVVIYDRLAIIFNKLLNNKKTFLHPLIKIISVFIIVGILGYTYIDSIYSGHHTIEEMFINNKTVLSLCILLFARIILMYLVMGSNTTGGIFIPTMAISSIIGALIGKLLIILGFDASYFPVVVLLSICSFIGGTLRSPISGVIFFIELTYNVNNILYIIIITVIVTIIVELVNQISYYDLVIENIMKQENKDKEKQTSCFELMVSKDSFILGKMIKDITWPNNTIVINVNSEKVIKNNDIIKVISEYYDEQEIKEQLYELVGNEIAKVE